MKLSLIIPCYNEIANLPGLLTRCQKVVERSDVEVVLVDNGSTDSSFEFLNTILPKYSRIRCVRVDVNRGYGYGVLAGLQSSNAEYLSWTHADMQTDPVDVLVGLDLLEKHGLPAYVKGLRYGRPIFDIIFTFGMSIFETILLRKFLWDINAQPNIFPKEFFDGWNNAPHDFSLDLFVYYKAKQQGLDVLRFPVLFANRVHGHSHWNFGWVSKLKFIQRTINFSLELKKRIKS